MTKPVKRGDELLLDLMRTVGGSEVDNEAQLRRGVLDVLLLEGAFLGLVGPRQALVQIDAEVERRGESDDTPTDGSPDDTRDDERTCEGVLTV